jgi:hypothetical protein
METLPSGLGHTPFRIHKFMTIPTQNYGHILVAVFVLAKLFK